MTQTPHKTTVNFISLGCPKNLVDTEAMIGILNKDDYSIVAPDDNSNVTIINTCSFVEDAKKESIDTILEVIEKKKKGGCQLIVITGCLPQRYIKELPTLLPEVDLFVGMSDYPNLSHLIQDKLSGKEKKSFVHNKRFLPDHLTPRVQTTPFYTKYVKISEGCSHLCSFCTIPFIRGELISRTPDDICEEIKEGVKNGVKEFNLVAQDLNEYGRDLKTRSSLYKLLKKLEDASGDFWIRLLYMYPLQFPDKLVELIAHHPHIAKYVDIPLQHISDRLLKMMKRGSSSSYIYRLLNQLKTNIPDIALRTTFIVGHPGETESDFEKLKSFLKEIEFDRVGVFKYSNEEGTSSYDMADHVEEEVMDERLHELMCIQKEISLKKNKSLIGKTVKVLFEGESQESELLYQGRTYGQAPDIDGVVLIRSGSAKIGSFCDVKIVDAFEYDLLGEIV